jgi:hypothetical protein
MYLLSIFFCQIVIIVQVLLFIFKDTWHHPLKICILKDFNMNALQALAPIITHLKFAISFDSVLISKLLPLFNYLKHLNVGNGFDHSLCPSFPPSITHLTFGDRCSVLLCSLPPSLTHLTIGNFYDKSVDSLPPSLLYLSLSVRFNRPLNYLPPSLTHLDLSSSWFDQPIEHLPKSLTILSLSYKFNQAINQLPGSLTHLTFGNTFNHPVDSLPSSLTHLTFV